MRLRCVPPLTVLVATAFVPPMGGLFAQTAQLQNPVVDSLQFPGGTVGEFVDMFARDQGINIVLRRGVKDLPMSAVDLKRVSRDDIVELICALASNEEAEARIERQIIGPPQGGAASRVYVLTLVPKANKIDSPSTGTLALPNRGWKSAHSAAPRSVQVVSLKEAAASVGRSAARVGGSSPRAGGPEDGGGVSGSTAGLGLTGGGGVAALEAKARDFDTVLTAIETALKFRWEQGEEPADIKFHAESGLLFVRAVPDQHNLIQEVVDQLDGSSARRERAKEKELSELVQELRDEIRALNSLGQMKSRMQGGMDDGGSYRSNLPNRSLRSLDEAKRYPLEKIDNAKASPNEAEGRLDPKPEESKPQKPQAK